MSLLSSFPPLDTYTLITIIVSVFITVFLNTTIVSINSIATTTISSL